MGHRRRDTDCEGHSGGERPLPEAGNERSEGLELGVTESQGPRSMFGKGGQGTAATLIPAKLSVRSGSDVTERSEESVRLGEQ